MCPRRSSGATAFLHVPWSSIFHEYFSKLHIWRIHTPFWNTIAWTQMSGAHIWYWCVNAIPDDSLLSHDVIASWSPWSWSMCFSFGELIMIHVEWSPEWMDEISVHMIIGSSICYIVYLTQTHGPRETSHGHCCTMCGLGLAQRVRIICEPKTEDGEVNYSNLTIHITFTLVLFFFWQS